MKHLEPEDRAAFAPAYDPAEVDLEFIPYLERINRKPFAATIQCCIGHCDYQVRGMPPAGHWGYLQLLMTAPSATWLCQEVRKADWLVLKLSKMWGGDAGEMPTYTARKNFIIAFGWDSSAWPTPAEMICSLLDHYHDADPVEPERFLNFELPDKDRVSRRPSLDRKKRGKGP